MDMKISGAGVLSGGEYEEVKISGSARIEGSVRCRSFGCSGATQVKGDLDCREGFHTSGSTHVEGSLSCGAELHSSGSTRVGGGIRAGSAHISGELKCVSLAAEKDVRISGGASVEGKLSGGDVGVTGHLKVGDGIEAEVFRLSGSGFGPVSVGGCLECQGLLNAETVEITLGQGKQSVTAIGGGSVTVKGVPEQAPFGGFGGFPGFGPRRFPWGEAPHGSLTVAESIEADRVTLEYTDCPLVTGRKVVIGKGCKIHAVRYSESIEIDPSAQVDSQEKY